MLGWITSFNNNVGHSIHSSTRGEHKNYHDSRNSEDIEKHALNTKATMDDEIYLHEVSTK